MKNINRLVSVIILSIASQTAHMAYAASNYSTNLQVQAAVIAYCTVTAATLNFGNYQLNQVDASTTITAKCTNGSVYTIALNGGNENSISARKMSSGGNKLSYNLYTDSSRLTLWGDGTTGSTVAGTGTGANQTLTVYGRITASQTAPLGSYSDTITITISFS